jgi:hypothetical protein
MLTALHLAPELVEAPAAPATASQHPTLAEIKARAKAIKKHRKHEGRCFFYGICSSLHALGFSF